MNDHGFSAAEWRKSSASGGNGQCVEVAFGGDLAALRDSKNSTGPAVVVPAHSLAALVASLSD
ncbi:hypothetical protein JOD54_000771 [Actinokineospora baliensis]|uniref:DUF397 domain-containing protein n=1 Tax=Actinokineospora baliensis TaxID=547056 RepID=UPI001957E15F|nr:DUF397 domain-containing protein [Actinokineospora baliensis]MBM7770567.1 hypothetical protein [Actinokineospora baliensis]